MSSDNAFRYPLDVRFFEVDSLGVVFNMWYLGWCDEAMSAFMESIGYGYARLRGEGFDAVLRNAQIEWADSLQAFERAEIVVRVGHVGATSFRLEFEVQRVDQSSRSQREATRCAEVLITYVCVEVDGRKKTPIPLGLRDALVIKLS